MGIDTSEAAVQRLRYETRLTAAPGRRHLILLAVPLGLLWTVIRIGVGFLFDDSLDDHLANAVFGAIGGVSLAVSWWWIVFRCPARSIRTMQRALVTQVRPEAVVFAVGDREVVLPSRHHRGLGLHIGDTVWVADPFTAPTRKPVVAVPADRPGGVVLWPSDQAYWRSHPTP